MDNHGCVAPARFPAIGIAALSGGEAPSLPRRAGWRRWRLGRRFRTLRGRVGRVRRRSFGGLLPASFLLSSTAGNGGIDIDVFVLMLLLVLRWKGLMLPRVPRRGRGVRVRLMGDVLRLRPGPPAAGMMDDIVLKRGRGTIAGRRRRHRVQLVLVLVW